MSVKEEHGLLEGPECEIFPRAQWFGCLVPAGGSVLGGSANVRKQDLAGGSRPLEQACDGVNCCWCLSFLVLSDECLHPPHASAEESDLLLCLPPPSEEVWSLGFSFSLRWTLLDTSGYLLYRFFLPFVWYFT